MLKKNETLHPSLEKSINKLRQGKRGPFEEWQVCCSLIKRLCMHPGKDELKVEWLLNQKLSNSLINMLFCAAAKHGYLALMQTLAVQHKIDPTVLDNHAIICAAENGHLKVARYLMTLDGVDPTAKHNDAIFWAARNGHLEMVQYLMTLPGIDPAAEANSTIRWAAGNGHLEVVRYLSTLKGVDPTAAGNDALRSAARNGHLEVVKYLLTLPSIDPAAQDNELICWAAGKGYLEVVEHLVTLPNVDPTAQDNEAIKQAWNLNELKIVAFLATLPEVKAQPTMDKTLQDTIRAIKSYYFTSLRYYQFFKSPALIKDIKQHIVQLGSTNLQKEFPTEVSSEKIIKAILHIKHKDNSKTDAENSPGYLCTIL